jgi:hypothetical protein
VKTKRLVSTILACVFTVFLMLVNTSIGYASLVGTNLAINALVLQNGQGGNGQGSNGQGSNGQGGNGQGGNGQRTYVPEPSLILMLGAVGVLALGGAAYRRFRK